MHEITLVTTTLNSEKYIDECISSVANQKEVLVKHVVVDGGSTDKTVSIVKKFKGIDLHIAPKTNIYQANNIGICNANTPYICFLNSDDYYPNDKILNFVVG